MFIRLKKFFEKCNVKLVPSDVYQLTSPSPTAMTPPAMMQQSGSLEAVSPSHVLPGANLSSKGISPLCKRKLFETSTQDSSTDGGYRVADELVDESVSSNLAP